MWVGLSYNCDAAVNAQQCMGSYGVVIRNHEDLVVLPGADIDVYSDDVNVAEAEALHFGLGLNREAEVFRPAPMESKSSARFTLGKQSSLAPDQPLPADGDADGSEAIDPRVRLMYMANEGDLDGIKELLDSGTDVNFRDIDKRTALHVAACQGRTDVVRLLLSRGADVDPEDRWGSTLIEQPLADAVYYKHHDVIKLLEEHGAKPPTAPMHVQNAREVPEYEIDPKELDFSNSVEITKGDLRAYLKQKGALKPTLAVKFALDIARGMNYLHENRPEAIIHRDLEPSNILRDDSGHLKVADFGLSKLLKFANTVKEDRPVTCEETSWRYAAPEVYKNEEYDTKVDVFSFALILQEMIEGCPPFPTKQEKEVPKAYIANERPPFRAPTKHYAYGLRELIEDCWSEEPFRRPTFRQILMKLDHISDQLSIKRHWKVGPLRCFQSLAALWKKGHADPSSRSSRSTNR
ncbi:Integrin-linked protein kinase family [Citrus sinensis]|uniref:Integrin-linked protein kinase family n=1 Tax=Citrus sinensis TaxID=2711 RepID=A0ACB8LBN5_CITSI|nr:Integrin-linked protein kinase family [Citrus sinensis]